MPAVSGTITVCESLLCERVLDALRSAGADERSAGACVHAMLHASRVGFDSHGVRLTPHYAAMLRAGRVNPRPNPRLRHTGPGTATLDGDDGLGHACAYAAVEAACELAAEAGVGAVGVYRSSHLGAAGAYAVTGAEAGFITLVTTNTDSVVALHGGSRAFHGTNPIAVAAPVPGQRPWLMELATSSMPFNRVAVANARGERLPEGVAADAGGAPTIDPAQAAMLLPLGGTGFGYKGAGLAGLVSVLSAVLTGATLDHELIPMFQTEDFGTPRNLGHFCLAIDPGRFAGREAFGQSMLRYVEALRAVPPRPGERVYAPGDREWETEALRRRSGIPIDQQTAAFLGLGEAQPTTRVRAQPGA
jgi:LDH2 family malate/lactate/ureidoglycolate dehydrogenase